MANIKELIQSIESGDSSFDEKLAAINQMEETLVAMREQEQEAVNDNVELIVEAIKLMEKKVADQLEIAKSIVPEKGDKGDKGQDGLQGRDGLNGKDGRDGQDGKNGLDGSDGVSVTDAKIDFDGSLIITLSTGREINVGEVVAPDLAERLNVISTMSTNTAVANITSGTIDGTVIGGTNPADGTFTDVSVTTASGESAFNENDTITGWVYSGNNFSISAQESTPNGLFIGSNGTKMYVNGSSGDDVNEYTLSTAWDITTATFVTVFSTAAQDTAPQDIFFKPDGLTMFIMGGTNDTVYQYTLTVAWDVSTASYASKSFSVTTQEALPNGIWFKPDGLVMYVVGSTADTVFQYTLGTAWDVSTASYASISYNISAQEGTANQVNLSANGLKMWVIGTTGDDIWEYTLGTAWNVSTATPVNNFYVGFQESGPTGLFIDSTAANRVYVVGSTFDTVYQYYTAANSLKLDTEKLYVDGLLSVNKDFVVGQNAYVDGALSVQGTGTINTVTAGNLSSSGTTSLATSTAAQTVSLGAGATASGALKTINIGTSGVSGSTTNINLGSAVSGSLGSIAIQSPTVNIGQTATQFAVINTASAVNYVQVTGAATGNRPAITVQGSDTNAGLNIQTKGTGSFFFVTGGSSIAQLVVTNTASSVNYINVTGGATGIAPVLSAQGSDTNIPLVLQPKGTGALQAQQTDSTATGGNARGANAVDWQTIRSGAGQVAAGQYSVVSGGISNTANAVGGVVSGGQSNFLSSSAFLGGIFSGFSNQSNGFYSPVVGGASNQANGYYNFIGGGFTNTGTANAAVTTQSGTMNGTTAVTLSGSNANIKVGQIISGTSIAGDTYVAAISGTSLTLSKVASGSSTSTLSFFTPHGVVVGGGNNQATGSYSFIGGGGDAGTAANRNVASGDWGTIAGGRNNTASGVASFVGGGGFTGVDAGGNTASGTCATVSGGFGNTASGTGSSVTGGFQNTANSTVSIAVGGRRGTTRSIIGNTVFSGSENPIADSQGVSQTALVVLARQTTDATATVLTSNASAAGTSNQVILPNNSAYYFKVEIIANVTGGGNTSGWELKGVIKRGANAASTAIVGSVTSTLIAQDAGASTWVVSATADTTNGGLKITCTGQASTTIRWVAKASTTEVTF